MVTYSNRNNLVIVDYLSEVCHTFYDCLFLDSKYKEPYTKKRLFESIDFKCSICFHVDPFGRSTLSGECHFVKDGLTVVRKYDKGILLYKNGMNFALEEIKV